jgi:hypothetical protein
LMVIEMRETGPIETDPKTRGLKKEVAEERKLGRSPDMFRKERTRGHAEDLSGQNGPEDKRIFPGSSLAPAATGIYFEKDRGSHITWAERMKKAQGTWCPRMP